MLKAGEPLDVHADFSHQALYPAAAAQGCPPPPPGRAAATTGLHRKLTLISAPAGFGKTTLVSAWVAGCDRPVAWLSLDAGDNDPTRFLTYLVAALQTIAPQIGAGRVGGAPIARSHRPPNPF